MDSLLSQDVTHAIIGGFYAVYNALGYGFLEHVYQLAMAQELRDRGLRVDGQVAVRVHYKGVEIAQQRLDMLVNDTVVVEIKATQELHRAAQRQVYSYLSATRLEVGLLLHFGPDARFYRIVKPNADSPRRERSPSPNP